MQRLAGASECEICDKCDIEDAVCVVTADAKLYIPMGDLVDFEAEKARLQKELDNVMKDLEFVNSKLSNENFVAKAPEKVVQAQRDAAAKYTEKMEMLKESIAKLG